MLDTGDSSDADIRATAFHEAGHCVAGVVYGRAIRYVTIRPGKRRHASGPVMLGRTVFRRPTGSRSSEQTKADIEAALMGCYAGAVCEAAAIGKPVDPSSAAADHKAALDMVSAFLGKDTAPAVLEEILKTLYWNTIELFKHKGMLRAVTRVAAALMAQGTLTGGEVKRIVLHAISED